MKFNLPFQVVDPAISGIISREILRQKISLVRASKKQLKEMAKVAKEIKAHGIPRYFVRKKLPDGLGHGIFLHPSSKPILKGQVIAPYSGDAFIAPDSHDDDSAYVFELIADARLTKEEQALLSPKLSYRAGRRYSINLDALKKGNFTRYINHSGAPNIVAHQVHIPSNDLGVPPSPLHIVYFAKKIIRPGEQLLVSYEEGDKSYWGPMKVEPHPIYPRTFLLTEELTLYSKRPS